MIVMQQANKPSTIGFGGEWKNGRMVETVEKKRNEKKTRNWTELDLAQEQKDGKLNIMRPWLKTSVWQWQKMLQHINHFYFEHVEKQHGLGAVSAAHYYFGFYSTNNHSLCIYVRERDCVRLCETVYYIFAIFHHVFCHLPSIFSLLNEFNSSESNLPHFRRSKVYFMNRLARL